MWMQLNARGLRGIRENDRFVVCLQGEDYQQRVEESEAAAGDHSGAEAASESASASALDAAVSSSLPQLPSIKTDALPPSSSRGYAQSSFASTVTTTGPPKGMGGFGSLDMKGTKRYRSISGTSGPVVVCVSVCFQLTAL